MIDYSLLQQKIKDICEYSNDEEFLYQFLQQYDIPKATLVRLGIVDGVKADVEVRVFNKLMYTYTLNDNLYTRFDALQKKLGASVRPRIIMLMNKREILAFDSKTNEWLSCAKKELYKECDYFYPLVGLERARIDTRQTVDIKIAEKFAQFYNEMLMLNIGKDDELNTLLPSLIAAFYADSFGIVESKSMFYWLTNYTKDDGTNVIGFLNQLFLALFSVTNSGEVYIESKIKRKLIGMVSPVLTLNFDKSTRRLLLAISEFDWSDVEPEVLGALIQEIAFPEEKAVAYNYTSTANIYKVIGPLFIEELDTKFENVKQGKLEATHLLEVLSKIRILDPSCGTGNFLMVSYRELKRLESFIKEFCLEKNISYEKKEYVNLENFYGIEANKLAATITRIGLLFTQIKYVSLECTEYSLVNTNVINAVATDISWEKFCPKQGYTVFIVGNPSYKGQDLSEEQKAAMQRVFAEDIDAGTKIGNFDYCTCWFYLATEYIKNTDCGFAFVTTNSLTQGTHVPTLWPLLFNKGIQISFAHSSFKWKNGGKNNTAVTVVIIGCRDANSKHSKVIYRDGVVYDARDISPYLTKGNVIVEKENIAPISNQLPKMIKGNMPYGEALLLTPREKDEIISIYPEAMRFLKRVVGAKEYIQGIERWCIWISDNELVSAMNIPFIADRLERVKEYRASSACSPKLKRNPHQFRETHMPQKCTLVVPAVSSENRSYFQVGFVDKTVVVTNLCFTLYDAEPWVFGIISSKMHNLWVRMICGGLETRPRYSNVLGYNTFPVPTLNENQKMEISEAAMQIILERENYSEMTLRELYNDDTMPQGLLFAHKLLDKVVERCYRTEEFYSDQERLDSMFLLYKELKGV